MSQTYKYRTGVSFLFLNEKIPHFLTLRSHLSLSFSLFRPSIAQSGCYIRAISNFHIRLSPINLNFNPLVALASSLSWSQNLFVRSDIKFPLDPLASQRRYSPQYSICHVQIILWNSHFKLPLVGAAGFIRRWSTEAASFAFTFFCNESAGSAFDSVKSSSEKSQFILSIYPGTAIR